MNGSLVYFSLAVPLVVIGTIAARAKPGLGFSMGLFVGYVLMTLAKWL
jgi:Na+(H+)/acetate symporter ActP